MAYSFLTIDNIQETYKLAKTYTEGITSPYFREFERIARNQPHPSIDKSLPRVTDGTTASIIRKTPHRVIQQLPTGTVKSDQQDWLSIVAGFIYTHKIIPYANQDYMLIQKCWSVIEKAMTFGACPTYAPFLNHNGNFVPDLTLPYWGDIMLQPGKKSDMDSNYLFMRSWWQTKDVEALISKEKALVAASKGRKEPYKPTWNLANLEKFKTWVSEKEQTAMTPAERDKAINSRGGVEFVTGFQRGVGAEFITFHGPTGEPLRTKENKDPRGEIPVNFMYFDTDGSNPFGRGVVELVGGLQNLMDSEMQMYQFNRALGLAPPLIKRGGFNKNKVRLEPNIVIDVGSDPRAGVEALKIDTTALTNFPNNYGLMKSQLLNLLASPDTSTSAEIGNPGFSKTPAGIQQIQANVSVDDNYARKQFETWFERWSETTINLYFAERSGVEELQLDKETANRLSKLAEEGKFDSSLLSDDNKIRVDYDTATEKLKFKVDASTSKMQDDVKQLRSLEGLTGLLDQSLFLQKVVPPQKQIELWNALVANSGIEDPEKLAIGEQELQQIQQQQMAVQAQGQSQQQADVASAPPLSPEDQQFIVALQNLGASDQQVGQALAMLHHGIPVEEIMQMLQGGQPQ